MSCNTVKNKRLEEGQQVRGFSMWATDVMMTPQHSSTDHRSGHSTEALGGEGKLRRVAFDLHLYELRCQQVLISLGRVSCAMLERQQEQQVLKSIVHPPKDNTCHCFTLSMWCIEQGASYTGRDWKHSLDRRQQHYYSICLLLVKIILI